MTIAVPHFRERTPQAGRAALAGAPHARAPMMDSQQHIVVCDDEPDIRDTVGEYLERQGFVVSQAEDGAALRAILGEKSVDAVVLDITMPGEDGLSIARSLRAESDVAIVMLTGNAEVVDRIIGLEMGADDYLAKPVDLRELLARLKAVLRRTAKASPEADTAGDAGHTLVRFGACRLDLEAHKLFDAAGEEIAITAMEYSLLKVFADHPNRVLNRDQLLELAHDRSWDPFDRSIDIRISRLTEKEDRDRSLETPDHPYCPRHRIQVLSRRNLKAAETGVPRPGTRAVRVSGRPVNRRVAFLSPAARGGLPCPTIK